MNLNSFLFVKKMRETFTITDFMVKGDSPKMEYKRRNDTDKKAVAYGQRKLLLTIIQFFSLYWKKEETPNPIVIYVGAFPGFNIKILSLLFPEFFFHLYDPKLITLNEPRIKVYHQFFTDEDALCWKENNTGNLFFISDIRTADYTELKDLDENETQIMEDMEKQMKWYDIIRPLKAHLKFRLPYSGDNRPSILKYLDGDIFKQCWAGQTSTETRLVPSTGLKVWNCVEYESQLFYHNVICREEKKYQNPFSRDNTNIDQPELLNDWDSNCETLIWILYMKLRKIDDNAENNSKLSRLSTILLSDKRKNFDSLSFLRKNPRAIKERNFSKKFKKQNFAEIERFKSFTPFYLEWLNTILKDVKEEQITKSFGCI
jgi:hypothetical protein